MYVCVRDVVDVCLCGLPVAVVVGVDGVDGCLDVSRLFRFFVIARHRQKARSQVPSVTTDDLMAMLRRILWQEPRTGRSGWLGRGNRSAGVARIDPCRGIAEGIPGMRARLLEGTRIKNMVRTRCHLSMHGSNRWYSSDTAFAGQRSHGLTVDQEPLPPGNDTTSVFVGMSGGVDSSVTALLLKQQVCNGHICWVQ